jgi:ankyrin repeat protein
LSAKSEAGPGACGGPLARILAKRRTTRVTIEDKRCWTALQLAALRGHEGVGRLLVTHGAPDPEDFYGLEKLFSKSSL